MVLLITLIIASILVQTMADIAGVMCLLWAALSVIYTFASKKLPNSNDIDSALDSNLTPNEDK